MTTATASPLPKDAPYSNGADTESGVHKIITWDEYTTDGAIYGRRYDIVEGVRRFMSSPIFRHQLVSGNVFALLRADERRCNGRAVFAPCDVLIRRTPRLQVRQPDLLFVANDRVRQQPGYETTGYLAVAPNLVVEILFDSDRKSVVAARRADYFAIGVDEVWIIQPEEQTATVLSQGVTAYTEIARYTPADTLVSVALPALVAPVSDFFDGLAPVVGVV